MKAPRTHLTDAKADVSSWVHRVTVCGMYDTATRPLVCTTTEDLVDCARCWKVVNEKRRRG